MGGGKLTNTVRIREKQHNERIASSNADNNLYAAIVERLRHWPFTSVARVQIPLAAPNPRAGFICSAKRRTT